MAPLRRLARGDLTLAHEEHLDDLLAGYGSPDDFPEVAVLRRYSGSS